MKKNYLACVLLLFISFCSYAQNPSYTDKLFYTCKLYGFVKYYHSEVSTCQVNWDSVLIDKLPAVKSAATKDEFNDVLLDMLNAAGPTATAPSPLPDTLAAERKRNRDWTWTNDAILRSDVSARLNTIKANFVPHEICYMKIASASVFGYLAFPGDTNYVYDMDVTATNEETRLQAFFKYWNMLAYFYPYNNMLDKPLHNTFYDLVLRVANAQNSRDMKLAFVMLNASLNDAHLENSGLNYASANDYRYVKVFTTYASGKYISTPLSNAGIKRGDEIVSVDGLTTQQWEDSLRPYISSGNETVFRRDVNKYMFAGPNGYATVEYKDSTGNIYTTQVGRVDTIASYYEYIPNAKNISLRKKHYSCGIVYLNPRHIAAASVDRLYSEIKDYPYIIVDMRYFYAVDNLTLYNLCEHLYAANTTMIRYDYPDTTYPGTYYNNIVNTVGSTNPNPYQGKVIVLVDEGNQSRGEFLTMLFQQLPQVITVGTQTAGTDGAICVADNVMNGADFHFTSFAVSYPNGDRTQRIGVGPQRPGDVLVQLTQDGIRYDRDEILEAALRAAGCPLTTEEIEKVMNSATIYPNPAGNAFSIKNNNSKNTTIKLFNLTGQLLLQTQQTQDIDISALPAGTYMVQVIGDGVMQTEKLVKE